MLGLLSIAGYSQQYISVSSKSADELVRDIFIGSQNANCITVSNVTVKGWQDYGNNPFSYGYFEKGTLPFDIDKGIILSTGNAQNAPGPNNSLLSDGAYDWLGDIDLASAFQTPTSKYINATALEFDFVANNTTEISFEYMLLSEEYQTSGCDYYDSFAFLIKQDGEANYNNIALVPGTNQPVSSQTVRGGTDCPRNPTYFDRFNYPPYSSRQVSPTNYDGQTKVLTAKTNIIPGERYHIKLVIADYSTTSHDSAVLLKAGSFVGKKDLGPDLLITTNNAICEGLSKTLDATTTGATSYQWFKDGNALTGKTNPQLSISGSPSSTGKYEVEVSLGGCILKGSIQVEIQPKATVNYGVFPFCDDNLDGSIPINFTFLSNEVIPNFSPTLIFKYYLDGMDAQNNASNNLQNGWLLTSDTDVFVRVDSSAGCLPVIGKVTLAIGNKTPLLKTKFTAATICDDQRKGSVPVDLTKYTNEFTLDNSITAVFFGSVDDARKNKNPISAQQTLNTDSRTFGIRLQNSTACANVGEITVTKKTPNTSMLLVDKEVCENGTTTLDAGAGFDYYKWSNGQEGISTSKISNVGVGTYYVDLTSNGCTFRQSVKITSSQLPQISNIDVIGSTATIFVNGGTPPYQYSVDNITFQSSNILTKLPRGRQTIYVKDAQNCKTVSKEFLILNLVNVITPNGDGKNDVLDYSDLSIKKEVQIEIYNRQEIQVFTAQKAPYIWDGKMNGRIVPTETYWYILRWIEPDSNLPITYKGWVLLKNRN